jgi:hypothetical protein
MIIGRGGSPALHFNAGNIKTPVKNNLTKERSPRYYVLKNEKSAPPL